MKYDRPVWQLMHACADAMPETFRYDDVRAWFTENFPEVGDATIRAHVVGLTEGGAKHAQFRRRSPIFRRVGRGRYAPIPFEERGELPEDDMLATDTRGSGAAEFFAVLDREPTPEPVEEAEPIDEAGPIDEDRDDTDLEDTDLDDEDEPAEDEVEPEPELFIMEGAEEFWPFPETPAPDPAERAAQARREEQKRVAKRQRKAARREAKRLTELEVEQARRELADAQQQPVEEPAPAPTLDLEVPSFPDLDPDLAARIAAAGRPSWEVEIEQERARLQAARLEAARREAEIEAERQNLASEREELARFVDQRAESDRAAQQGIDADRARLAAAQQEAARLQAARVEAERVADQERKRANKVRKAARKERELADMLDRDRVERKARRRAERKARESAERHLREAAERRRVEEEERRLAIQALREELAHDPEPSADRSAFEQAERDRLDFEREQQEQEQLDREEQELRRTLAGPVVEEDPVPADPEPSHGGIVIVRAPRGEGRLPAAETLVDTPLVDDGDQHDDPIVLRRPSDAIVLGSLGDRLGVPAPAKDAYRDLSFQLARRDAERSGSRWFVLSAEHGLLEPQEWVSPDDRGIADIPPRHRAIWAAWVAARLELLVGDLAGLQIHVDAPEPIALPVVEALHAAGADTTVGTAIHVVEAAPEVALAPEAERLYEVELDEAVDEHDDEEPGDEEVVDEEADDQGADADVLPFVRLSSITTHLQDPRHAVPAELAAALPHHPGLYAWSVDSSGSRMLNRALMLPVRPGVVYVGQVGAGIGPDSGFSLNDHVTRVQLHGRARASTFRMTLATALAGLLGLHTIEDPRLTQWMLDHLSVTVWPADDVASLESLTASVVEDLRPVLNTDQGRAGEYSRRIAELRDRLA